MLDALTDWATRSMAAGGPLMLALLMFAENVFPPIPSEVVLPFAGFLVSSGDLGVVAAVVGSTVGSVAGALALYAVGRYGGRPLVLRHGHLLRIKEAELDRADDWFDRHGAKVVFVARMVPFARSVVSIPAGASEMPIGRFVLLTTAGTAIWNSVLLAAGYLLGDRWDQVSRVVSTYSTLMLAMVALVTVLAAAWWWRRARRRGAPPRS